MEGIAAATTSVPLHATTPAMVRRPPVRDAAIAPLLVQDPAPVRARGLPNRVAVRVPPLAISRAAPVANRIAARA